MNTIKKQINKILIIITLFLINFKDVYSSELVVKIENPLKGGAKSLPEILNLLLDQVVIPVGSVIIVLAIIWTGYKFITSQGNTNELKTQKENLKYVVIGSALLLGAKAISIAIQGTFSQLLNF